MQRDSVNQRPFSIDYVIPTFTSSCSRSPAGAVELRNAVAALFSVDLPATVTFDYPTPAALAAFVHSQLPQPSAAAEAGAGAGANDVDAAWAPAVGRRRRQRGAARSGAAQGGGNQQCASAVTEQLSAVVAGVLGAAVPPEQPLMEVRGAGRRWGWCSATAAAAATPCCLLR